MAELMQEEITQSAESAAEPETSLEAPLKNTDARQMSEVLSQKEYRPTPFESTLWEVVGERIEERNFISMELEVMRDLRASADPMFESFDDSTDFSQGAVWNTPGGDPSSIVEKQAEESTPQIDQEWLDAQFAEKFEEGRRRGFEEGKAEAEKKIVESYEALGKRMQEVTSEIQRQVREHVGELEKRALQLTLDIAKKITETTSELNPEYILNVIRKALRNMGAAKPFRIRVSQQDYEFLQVVGLPPELAETELGVQYIADETVKAGCIVETDFGEVNLELDKMWEEVKASLCPTTE